MSAEDTAGEIAVTWVEDASRWEARTSSGELAGLLDVVGGDGVVDLVHTGVEPAFEGRGVGGLLARAALDEARAAGSRVVPSCPFVRAWIGRHPDYADLVEA